MTIDCTPVVIELILRGSAVVGDAPGREVGVVSGTGGKRSGSAGRAKRVGGESGVSMRKVPEMFYTSIRYRTHVAEREGFEPPEGLRLQLISSQPRSATPAPLRGGALYSPEGSRPRLPKHTRRPEKSDLCGLSCFLPSGRNPGCRLRGGRSKGRRAGSPARGRARLSGPVREPSPRWGILGLGPGAPERQRPTPLHSRIRTSVPAGTRSNSSTTSRLRMRMQPWEPGTPRVTSSGVPWM